MRSTSRRVRRAALLGPFQPNRLNVALSRGRTKARKRSARYACLGNLRMAFEKACKAAGLVVGRKHGGLVWHCTRNTAATDLAANGCAIEDVMTVGGWRTAEVARRYDLGNLDALRARITAARTRGTVARLADKRKAQA